MNFCTQCENMYYMKLSKEDNAINQLIYYCKKCGNEEEVKDSNNLCVLKVKFKRDKQQYSHIINKYTKFDPTLPRILNIKCPNKECESNTGDKKKEIIFIRYDDINMKYVYLCTVCDYVWETNRSN